MKTSEYIEMINLVTDTLIPEASAAFLTYRGRFTPLLLPGGKKEAEFDYQMTAENYAKMIALDFEEKTNLKFEYTLQTLGGKYYIYYTLGNIF